MFKDSIESLLRNEIQQHKIDMANEIIDAGRFNMKTTNAERRDTLEEMLKVTYAGAFAALALLSSSRLQHCCRTPLSSGIAACCATCYNSLSYTAGAGRLCCPRSQLRLSRTGLQPGNKLHFLNLSMMISVALCRVTAGTPSGQCRVCPA